MMNDQKPEVWLRGPISGIPDLLQPAAHALVQATEDANRYTQDLPINALWSKAAGRASVGFHLQHLTGVLDRMLTYARAQPLTDLQFAYLKKEGMEDDELSLPTLVEDFESKVNEALDYFKTIPSTTLTEKRTVGRQKLPSTVIGLLFHAAEHAQRHVGQLLVSVSILKKLYPEN